jgi:excisionase family DNA binding protein
MKPQSSCRENALLLPPECVAERLGMSVTWVKRESHKGRIPHTRLGKAYRYRPSEIEAFANGSKHGIPLSKTR